MKRFKSILFVSLLTITLSSTVLAGDITGRSAMAPGDITGKPGDITGKPGDITGLLTWGDITGVLGILIGAIR